MTDAKFHWKNVSRSFTVDYEDKEPHDMAEIRKELRSAHQKTSRDIDAEYDAWSAKSPRIPTMKDDPDFGPSLIEPKGPGMVWNGMSQQWEKASQAIDAVTLRNERDRKWAKAMAGDFEDRPITPDDEDEPVKQQSLSKEYIDMVDKTEVAGNLKKSMDILFPEGDDNGSDS